MDDNLTNFMAITGADANAAQFYVEAAGGNVELAVANFFDGGGGGGGGFGGGGFGGGGGANLGAGGAPLSAPMFWASSSTAGPPKMINDGLLKRTPPTPEWNPFVLIFQAY